MTQKKNVWLLADDRAGNVSQILGVANSLNAAVTKKDIRYNRFVQLNWA